LHPVSILQIRSTAWKMCVVSVRTMISCTNDLPRNPRITSDR
jgi:hypothetical protein